MKDKIFIKILISLTAVILIALFFIFPPKSTKEVIKESVQEVTRETNKWEYKTYRINGVYNCNNYQTIVHERFLEDLDKKLKEWGEDGWELVSFTKTGEDKYYLTILKRKIQ